MGIYSDPTAHQYSDLPPEIEAVLYPGQNASAQQVHPQHEIAAGVPFTGAEAGGMLVVSALVVAAVLALRRGLAPLPPRS